MAAGKDECIGSLVNRILLGMFLLHYLQRAFIFPFLIRGGKPTPLMIMFMSIVFCLTNGYIQVNHLAALDFRYWREIIEGCTKHFIVISRGAIWPTMRSMMRRGWVIHASSLGWQASSQECISIYVQTPFYVICVNQVWAIASCE